MKKPLRRLGFLLLHRPKATSWARGMFARVTAPAAGSVLPWRLSRAVRSSQPAAALCAISGASARWFFGGSLTFWTDPKKLVLRLNERVSNGGNEIWLSERFVDGSDWSEAIRPESTLREHQTMLQLAHYRTDYPNMPIFAELLREAKQGRPVRRLQMKLTTEERIHIYFRHFLALIEAIEATGMKDRYSLGPYMIPDGAGGSRLSPHQSRNIGVAITTDCSLLRFLGGRHRIAIAQALGLTSVPVELRLVHADWLLAEVRRTGLAPVEAIRRFVRSAPPPRRGIPGAAIPESVSPHIIRVNPHPGTVE